MSSPTAGTLAERARAIIDSLDARVEAATFLEGADRPHCVAMVGTFHTAAGKLERKLPLLADFNQRTDVARLLRQLRWLAREHRLAVEAAGARIREARMATVQRVIKQAKRGVR